MAFTNSWLRADYIVMQKPAPGCRRHSAVLRPPCPFILSKAYRASHFIHATRGGGRQWCPHFCQPPLALRCYFHWILYPNSAFASFFCFVLIFLSFSSHWTLSQPCYTRPNSNQSCRLTRVWQTSVKFWCERSWRGSLHVKATQGTTCN